MLGGQLDQVQQETALPVDQDALISLAVQAVAAIQYPGLPPLPPNIIGVEFHQYDGSTASQLTEATPSKQYLRVPSLALAIDAVFKNDRVPRPGLIFSLTNSLNAYVISPPGSAHPFGDLPPFRTRLLAFGALPVEATVHLAQVRDSRDLPEKLVASQPFGVDSRNYSKNEDATFTGRLQVRVSDLAVDGVPVDVGAQCTASSPAILDLVGRGFWDDLNGHQWTLDSLNPTPETSLTPAQVKNDFYVATSGGLLTGTVDIPSFTGCIGPAGDLSRLVSSAVSSADQPIAVRQGASGSCFPEVSLPTCTPPDPFPYPTTEDFPYPPTR